MPIFISLAYLILAIAGLTPKLVPLDAGAGVIKTLPAILLALCAWRYSRPRFGPWIAVAVALGAVGDYSLANSERAWFMAGLCAFLAGHVAYCVAFAKDLRWTRLRGAVIGVMAAAMAALVVVASAGMAHAGEAALIAPVAIYTAVMGIMMTLAVLHQSPTAYIAAGGVLFVISDAHIAVNHMVLSQSSHALSLSGLGVYYLAQYLLVAGAVHESRLHKQNCSQAEKRMIKAYRVPLCVLLAAAFAPNAMAAGDYTGIPYTDGDVYADTWVATDAAGRTQPDSAQAGPPKKDKWVGIFYWTWHIPNPGGPNDNTKIIAAAGDSPTIEWPVNGAPHHWGEPELGYYRMTDPFVIRKHASMLADAGVDVILFDTTNPPHTWKDEYEALCREYTAMRQEGARTPAIGFITPFWNPVEVVDRLWKDLYQPGLWKDLWFMWDGKPLLLANSEFIKDPAMLDFFTFRRPMPDYWQGPSGPDQWSWLEVFPQHVFKNSKGEAEQMSVGVGQNALPNTPGPAPMSQKSGAMGRSWHNGAKDPRPDAVNLGLNFEEQWTRALEVNPAFVFVTGWNEWTAGRYTEWSVYKDTDSYYPGGLFVDEYTQEYSRDCEPMRGGHTDNYYYQLASWVRKFKGVREQAAAPGPSAIALDGAFGDWTTVTPEYRDTIGDVTHRDHLGYGNIPYRNDTGRNDFVMAKAAYDEEYLYFFVQTRAPISPRTDPNWMLLLLDTDRNATTGWLGYDYVVNREVPSDDETTIQSWRDGAWQPLGAASYRVNGNAMELRIPRATLKMPPGKPAFDFHWADNIQSFGDISELGVNGDSAPNRRWNYRYSVAP